MSENAVTGILGYAPWPINIPDPCTKGTGRKSFMVQDKEH